MIPNKCPCCQYQGKVAKMPTDISDGDTSIVIVTHNLEGRGMVGAWQKVMCPNCMNIFMVFDYDGSTLTCEDDKRYLDLK